MHVSNHLLSYLWIILVQEQVAVVELQLNIKSDINNKLRKKEILTYLEVFDASSRNSRPAGVDSFQSLVDVYNSAGSYSNPQLTDSFAIVKQHVSIFPLVKQ